jgi:formamidopyrimidine-DNA glycosylase
VPELPDLAILAEAFDPALGGRPVLALEPIDPLVVRATPAERATLSGQFVRAVDRRGKHLVLKLDAAEIWVTPMLTGRLQLASPQVTRPRAAARLDFGPRRTPARHAADWTIAAPWLPADGADVVLRYLDPTRMGKLTVIPAGSGRVVAGAAPDDLGPDADDPALDLETWRARIRRHPGELKGLLRNQAFVAGIGNAYSDEILHAARLAPFRRRSSLAPEEVDELYRATRATLAEAIALLRARVPPTFERQVRDQMKVHLRGGQPCPRCGTTISQVSPGGQATSYCRGCQR